MSALVEYSKNMFMQRDILVVKKFNADFITTPFGTLTTIQKWTMRIVCDWEATLKPWKRFIWFAGIKWAFILHKILLFEVTRTCFLAFYFFFFFFHKTIIAQKYPLKKVHEKNLGIICMPLFSKSSNCYAARFLQTNFIPIIHFCLIVY